MGVLVWMIVVVCVLVSVSDFVLVLGLWVVLVGVGLLFVRFASARFAPS